MQISAIEAQESILVVDDTPNNLKLLFQYLDSAGYKVFVAQTGEIALQIANFAVPDLILLDVAMLETDGFSICRQLKNYATTKDIPVIFMTALNETKYKVRSFNAGAIDYVTKPVDCAELLACIANHLKLKSLTHSLELEVQQKQLLFDVAERIRQSLDLSSIFKTAIQEIRNFLDCDRLSLIRLSQQNISVESQSLSHRAIYESREQLTIKELDAVRQENSVNVTIKNYCLATDCSSLGSSANSIVATTQSQLLVPIILNQVSQTNRHHPLLWGWLVAEHYSSRQWQETEQVFLQGLTTQLAIAINQGSLYQQLQNTNQQLHMSNQHFKRLALYDSLTEIYNRRYFQQQLDREWRRLRRSVAPLSLILCDIDCFKLYNDTYGHQKGDLCLQQVAKALISKIKRPGDILARYGGEEFVLILPETDRTGAIKVAETLRATVKKLQISHVKSTVDSVITISAGIATTLPKATENYEMLIEAADRALYQAKSRGRDCIAVYQYPIAQSKHQQNQELQWNRRIRQALAENLFSLYAQPIASLKADSRKRFEILLRLEDRGQQVFTPGDFFEVAERNSLMPRIDRWVINQLLDQLSQQPEFNWQNYQFSINLSGASLNDRSFLNFLSQKLTEYRFPPRIFCFEITEAIAIDNIQQIRDFILSLKNLGCSFALDDFGKGMSSLTYLKNLPVDYLKIDGSFITELHTDEVSKIMVEAINHLAVGIGLKTVAEFVENQAILDTLRHLKIDYAQGYHLGRPRKFAEVI